MSMKWAKLKENKCPKCGKYLYFQNPLMVCANMKCGFKIMKDKFQRLVSKQVSESVNQVYGDDGYLR